MVDFNPLEVIFLRGREIVFLLHQLKQGPSRESQGFHEYLAPPGGQVAVLALRGSFPTNMGHRCEESGGESQFVSICSLGPGCWGWVEVAMGLASISGLSSRLTWKPQCPAHHSDEGLTVSLLRINTRGPGLCSGMTLTLGIRETRAQLLTSWTKHLIFWMESLSEWW